MNEIWNLIRLTERSWNRVKAIICRQDRYICQYCGKFDLKGEPDHVLPLGKGGTDAIHNLVWACRDCNRNKGGRTIREWIIDITNKKRAEVEELIKNALEIKRGSRDQINMAMAEVLLNDTSKDALPSTSYLLRRTYWIERGVPEEYIHEWEISIVDLWLEMLDCALRGETPEFLENQNIHFLGSTEIDNENNGHKNGNNKQPRLFTEN